MTVAVKNWQGLEAIAVKRLFNEDSAQSTKTSGGGQTIRQTGKYGYIEIKVRRA